MECGLALIISGFAFVIGAIGDAVWGVGADEGILYWTGGLLCVVGSALLFVVARSGSMGPTGAQPGTTWAGGSAMKVARMIQMAETQLLALTMERNDINGRAMGILAFDGALAALLVAAEDQWHRHVELALIGLGLSIFLAARAVRSTPDVGPKPQAFLDELHESPDGVFDVALLTRLSSDIAESETSAERGRAGTEFALSTTLVTLVVAILLALL
jgi:hypothetical protein